MIIRKAEAADMDKIMEIYAYAREQMKLSGNPTQWGDEKPYRSVVENDIREGNTYVTCDDEGVSGVFAFIIGEDPTYKVIEDGAWLNDEEYGTIHRVAAGSRVKGLLSAALDFCEKRMDNVRIDTHDNNKIMQHILEKNGYVKCGIIYIDDGTPRLAYHKKVIRG